MVNNWKRSFPAYKFMCKKRKKQKYHDGNLETSLRHVHSLVEKEESVGLFESITCKTFVCSRVA